MAIGMMLSKDLWDLLAVLTLMITLSQSLIFHCYSNDFIPQWLKSM